MECFMECEPTEADKDEQFYVAILPELTIYGHTINRWIREKYPEDWAHVRDTQARGIYWGCWHSQVEPRGEIGSQDPAICVPMERVAMQLGIDKSPVEMMEIFAEQGWPDLQMLTGLTADRPVISIWVAENDSAEALLEGIRRGTLREAWNSIEGDKDVHGGSST